MKAFMVAGTSSGVGKTSVTLGLMRALSNKGLKVRGYKVGPDYIDTSYHDKATGYESINLDSFMVASKELLENIFSCHLEGMDVGIIEGVMGLYDGLGSDKDNASSAHIAKLLSLPVFLVVDVKSMSTSAAAYVKGFQALDPQVNIAGVILNRVASPRHLKLVKESIEKYTRVPVVGYLKKREDISLPSRHLGLVPSVENDQTHLVLEELAKEVDSWAIDLVSQVPEIRIDDRSQEKIDRYFNLTDQERLDFSKLTLGVAKDEAFHFYYPDNLKLLESWGVKLKYFSPLHDQNLVDADAYYIGGGFPEVFAKELEMNESIRQSIRSKSELGVPIYGECGGLMYLGESLQIGDETYQMTGCIPGISRMTKSLKRFGYTIAKYKKSTLLGEIGEEVKGHEFHHSEFISDMEKIAQHRKEINQEVLQVWEGGYQIHQTLGSYLHIHFYQNPNLAKKWLGKIIQLKKEAK